VAHYCFRADYTGDTNYPESTDNALTECFQVTPVTPTLSTKASSSPVLLGSSISDSAKLVGTANEPGTSGVGADGSINADNSLLLAKGTITFKLFGPNTCTSLAAGFPSLGITVNVSGDDATFSYGGPSSSPPVTFTPAAIGVYHWKASYSGDLPNTNGTTTNDACGDTNEDVTVVEFHISTAQSFFPNDSATVSTSDGTTNVPAGSVVFTAYSGTVASTVLSNCQANGATGRLFTQAVTVTAGSSPQMVSTSNTTVAVPPGTIIYWNVSFTSAGVTGRNSVCVETTTLNITDDPGPGTTP